MTSFSLCFPDIGAKHLETESLTPKAQVLVVAFKVYQGWQRPFTSHCHCSYGPPKPGNLSPCFKCSQEGHWAQICPNALKLYQPCPMCCQEGHWAVDCPPWPLQFGDTRPRSPISWPVINYLCFYLNWPKHLPFYSIHLDCSIPEVPG